jgi:hypothetical protein
MVVVHRLGGQIGGRDPDGPDERLSSHGMPSQAESFADTPRDGRRGGKSTGAARLRGALNRRIPRSRHVTELHCGTRARPRIGASGRW